MKYRFPLLGLALLFASSLAFAATGLNQTWDVEFTHTNGNRSVNWCKSIPLPSGEERYFCGQRPGETWLELGWGYRPAGTINQTLRFDMYSDGYFSQSNGHFAFALRGHWPFGASNINLPTGRGIIIGHNQHHPTGQGCNPGPAAQIELYRDTYPVFRNSCSFALQDRTWYSVSVEARSDNTVSYTIRDLFGRVVYRSASQYDALATNGLDAWIAEVGPSHGNWSMLFSGVRVEWW